ncbi:hypothetical protein SODALDRAFT_364170 [Sodiomyces alkalinus F11]|uniref:Uncharacterized protein n=1 Tax=Sodiomyces alkalinus (strain CBS 110278 / VKM F-3762 / F11) TaxID=1314773 RepID=A0A3N2PJF9_SODAK|nr:hypothetical protein SODALDRAFT_364170 [Sodiomyces alkalinus F11]ROT34668.1 hypothetical protein SODALDRAFT_364170 [Sodiomyces alkalinus F11]
MFEDMQKEDSRLFLVYAAKWNLRQKNIGRSNGSESTFRCLSFLGYTTLPVYIINNIYLFIALILSYTGIGGDICRCLLGYSSLGRDDKISKSKVVLGFLSAPLFQAPKAKLRNCGKTLLWKGYKIDYSRNPSLARYGMIDEGSIVSGSIHPPPGGVLFAESPAKRPPKAHDPWGTETCARRGRIHGLGTKAI